MKIIKLLFIILIIELIPFQESTYTLPVDPAADLVSYMSQPLQVNTNNELAMFSYNEHALIFYDLESKEVKRKIKYQRQGPNGLSNMKYAGSFNHVNRDTIIFFSNQQNRAFLSDSNGNIYKRVTIKSDSVGFGSIGIQKPFAYRDGSIYIQSWPVVVGKNKIDNPETRPNMIGKIHIDDGLTEEILFEFPEKYESKNYAQGLKNLDIIYNQRIDKFIISFPLSDSIYVTDFNGYKKAYLAKSQLVSTAEEIDKHENRVDAGLAIDFTIWLSDKYEKLFFDPESSYYFRVASKGLSERAYKAKNYRTQKEIIVLDNEFRHVKTIKHNGGLFLYYFFLKNKVFWNKSIVEYNFETGNEDILYFDQHSFR